MCPEAERQARFGLYMSIFERDQDNQPDEYAMVKEYRRSGADQEEPLPEDLRTPQALELTMQHLVCKVMDDPRLRSQELALEWYDFLWDRLRAIRKDITQQRICDQASAVLVEQCARFHVHSCYAMNRVKDFDVDMNKRNLNDCLQMLRQIHTDLRIISNSMCPGEIEFQKYDILLHLNEDHLSSNVLMKTSEHRTSNEMKYIIKVFNSYTNNDYYTFFKLMQQADYMTSCILSLYANKMRLMGVRAFIAACLPRQANFYPLDMVINTLGFDGLQDAQEFASLFELEVEMKDSRYYLVIKKELAAQVRRSESTLPPFKSKRLVEDKMQGLLVGQLVYGSTELRALSGEPQTSIDYSTEEPIDDQVDMMVGEDGSESIYEQQVAEDNKQTFSKHISESEIFNLQDERVLSPSCHFKDFQTDHFKNMQSIEHKAEESGMVDIEIRQQTPEVEPKTCKKRHLRYKMLRMHEVIKAKEGDLNIELGIQILPETSEGEELMSEEEKAEFIANTTISWFKDDVRLDEKAPETQGLFQFTYDQDEGFHRLVVRRATKETEGVYTCLVENESGTSSCSTQLVVGPGNKPKLTSRLQDVTVYVGQSLEFRIKSTGLPPIDSCQWFKDDELIVELASSAESDVAVRSRQNERISMSRSEEWTATGGEGETREKMLIFRLCIDNLKLDDTGRYKCRINNQFGYDESDCQARVIYETLVEKQGEANLKIHSEVFESEYHTSGGIIEEILPRNDCIEAQTKETKEALAKRMPVGKFRKLKLATRCPTLKPFHESPKVVPPHPKRRRFDLDTIKMQLQDENRATEIFDHLLFDLGVRRWK